MSIYPWVQKVLPRAGELPGVETANLPLLGSGANGQVFDLGAGRVLKITASRAEVMGLAALSLHDPDLVPRIEAYAELGPIDRRPDRGEEAVGHALVRAAVEPYTPEERKSCRDMAKKFRRAAVVSALRDRGWTPVVGAKLPNSVRTLLSARSLQDPNHEQPAGAWMTHVGDLAALLQHEGHPMALPLAREWFAWSTLGEGIEKRLGILGRTLGGVFTDFSWENRGREPNGRVVLFDPPYHSIPKLAEGGGISVEIPAAWREAKPLGETMAESWDSPQGLRQVVREEGGRFYVQTGSRRATLDLLTWDQLQAEKLRDAANLAYRNKNQAEAEAAAQAEAAEEAELQTALAGFVDDLVPMRRAKAVSALTAMRRFDGVTRRIIDQVRDLVGAGAVVKPHPKDGRRIVMPGDSFLSERDLSKTALDYAEHLIRQKAHATPPSAPALAVWREAKPSGKTMPGQSLVRMAFKGPTGGVVLFGVQTPDGWVYTDVTAFNTTGAWSPEEAAGTWTLVDAEYRRNLEGYRNQTGKWRDRLANAERVERNAARLISDGRRRRAEQQAGLDAHTQARKVETERQINNPRDLVPGTVVESPGGDRYVARGFTARGDLLLSPFLGSPNEEGVYPADRPLKGFAVLGTEDELRPVLIEDPEELAGGECSLPVANACRQDLPVIRVGLPYGNRGRLLDEVLQLGAPTLLSVGSMFRGPRGEVTSTGFPTFQGFTPIGAAAWATDSSLDSAGFTAMLAGGYRWSPEDYVDFVVTNRGDGTMPFPWSWWSAMDYCVEPQIAKDREEVQRRMQLTVETYGRILDHLQHWRSEGVTDVPDPMPILQGRTPEDYVWSAKALAKEIDQHHDCSCPTVPTPYKNTPAFREVACADSDAARGTRWGHWLEVDSNGVIPGAPRQLDRALNRGEFTLAQVAAGWESTRAFLRAKHGDRLVLYRMDAPRGEHHPETRTTYYANEKMAAMFAEPGRTLRGYVVPVDDIVAVYCTAARRYVEILARPPQHYPVFTEQECPAEWHREHAGLPALVGLGSVCRRELHGPEGLLTILVALDKVLAPHVKLHLFGVKGAVLEHLRPYLHRVKSIDSMAWDEAATRSVQKRRKETGTTQLKPGDPGFLSNDTENRAAHMREWHDRQQERLGALTGRPHTTTFPGGRTVTLGPSQGAWQVLNVNPTSRQQTEDRFPTYPEALAAYEGHLGLQGRLAPEDAFDRAVAEGHLGEKLRALRQSSRWAAALCEVAHGHPGRSLPVNAVDTEPTTGETPGMDTDLAPADLTPSARRALELFVLGKPLERDDVLLVLDTLGVAYTGLREVPRGLERLRGHRFAAQVTIGGFPIVLERWVDALKLQDGTYYPYGDEGETQRKEEARRRRAAIEGWKVLAKGRLGGLDPKVKQALERVIKKVDVGSAKVLATVLGLLGLPPAPRELGWEEGTPEERKARRAEIAAHRAELRVRAAAKLGVKLPEVEAEEHAWEEQEGFRAPVRPTGYKLGEWTCTGCFETHAVTADQRIVHHGYRRPGDGRIHGDCMGVGFEPWEKGLGVVAEVLRSQLTRSEELRKRLHTGWAGHRWTYHWADSTRPLLDTAGRRKYHPLTGALLWEREQIEPSDPRWPAADAAARANAKKVLQRIWAPLFMGIPWLRAAIREWRPSEKGPVGAPSPTIEAIDHAQEST